MNWLNRIVTAGRKLATIVFGSLILTYLIAGQSPVLSQLEDACDSPANAIVAENCLPGNPASEWEISGAGDASVQGFATDISVNRGGTISFKIGNTDPGDGGSQRDPVAPPPFRIDIYRLGYYGGAGARLVHTIADADTTETDQPACSLSSIPIAGGSTTSGQLLDCGNWTVSASWTAPTDATSGVYIARPTRTDNGGASHVPFIVRDDASNSALLFQTSDTTWQSYNPYGGYNAYGSSGATMAEKLSYNRPFATRGAELENYLFNAEYPMIRWLERNGYDVTYFSAVDTERNSSLITNHDVFLSVGHDEYWSQGRRDAVTAAREAGVHLAFFSANEIYWKTRWEASTADGGSTDYRTQVVYKEGSSAPSGSAEHRNCYNNYECDPSDIWTGLWREAPGSTPENSLSGQISWRLTVPGASMTVPGEYAPLRFWRDTAVATLGPTDELTLGQNILGYEWDPEYPEFADWYPAGRVLLSTTNQSSFAGPDQHHLSLYRATSGALVFGAGTVQWSWGLDATHDYGPSVEDVNVQQATVNLLADMGVQPANLQTNLVAATASTDSTPPTVTVTSPASGASVPGGAVTITGTAVDADGAVGIVEISTDGGATWRRATGRENWSYTYVAPQGLADIRVRAADDSINLSAPLSHTFNVEPRACSASSPCSLWDDATTPTEYKQNGNPIETGTRFRTDVAGFIRGIRFYIGQSTSATFTAHLWSNDGQLLGEATFPGAGALGWVEATFATPIPVQANTTYVASYFSPNNYYAYTNGYFATAGFANPPLYALRDGEDGANGVYRYDTPGFPTQTFESSNYWVDVTFVEELASHTFFDSAELPPGWNGNVSDNQAIELGMRFRTTIPGEVIALRFFKAPSASGEMVASLWAEAGTLLASGSINAVADAGGWREIVLPTPIPLTVGANYVVSYFSPDPGWFVISPEGAFATDLVVGPLVAPANVVGAPNGVYRYGGGFPGAGGGRNYYVDVVVRETPPPDTTPPTVISTSPAANAGGVGVNANVTATFSEAIDPATLTASTFELRDPGNALVAAAVSYSAGPRTATLDPDAALANNTTYQATLKGGTGGIADLAGNPLTGDVTWSFTTAAPPPPPPDEGPGGPILVIASAANPFTRYYAEILRTEGLNAFLVTDMSAVDATLLAGYDVAILGEMPLTTDQVTMLTNWVTNGGNLIAMRPDAQLAGLLGLNPVGATPLAEGYLLVNTAAAPGTGIVGETVQFHGEADVYTLSGATALATLYADATTPTAYPAVTARSVGVNGGQAMAFTYDLARSIVLTRQGNPAWRDINGDGSSGPVRSDDLFHNGSDPDWVNLNKVAIPQADEQQRLLANMIGWSALDRLPLPRFWYLPRGEKAVVVMTHDEHGGGNVASRLDYYNTNSPAGCSIADWECIRSTTYMYTNAQLSDAQVAAYQAQGHEFVVHVDTGCANYSFAQLQSFYATQIPAFSATFPSAASQRTQRTHCIAWSGWVYQPTVQLQNGMRLDTNYYYWPQTWIQNRPGMFTGSGMPMRFADLDGAMIDVYQATTQMTDESGQTYPFTIDALLDNALGPNGYYGVFTTNIHTDGGANATQNAQAIVQSALARGVPVISAVQLLDWLDGRNGSSFADLAWDGQTLSFNIAIGAGANGLQAMAPAYSADGATISSIERSGAPVAYTVQTIKGVQYAIFTAGAGAHLVTYEEDTTPPTVTAVTPLDGAADVPLTAVVTATFSEPLDPATVNQTTFTLRDAANQPVATAVGYDAGSNTATLTPAAPLAANTLYNATLSGVTDLAGNSLASDFNWSFTTASPMASYSIWDNTPSVGGASGDTNDYELGVKFRSDQDGLITALRFYKHPANSGTHIGRLWAMNGTLLGAATYTNETASGWQEVALDPPVAITANTVYVASYSTLTGNYAFSGGYFATQGVSNGPLYALSGPESPAPGTNGVFNETPGAFPNTSFNNSNYWVDVVFEPAAPDTEPPIISNVQAVAHANGTATVTWTTDEPATSRVEYGLASGALNLFVADPALVTSHSLLLTGLDPETTYYYRVLSTDDAGNPAASAEFSFQTPAPVLAFTDTTVANFSAGIAGACVIDPTIDDGALRLPALVDEDFSGDSLPAGWLTHIWSGSTNPLVADGRLTVNGSMAYTDAGFGPGRVLEFVATFNAQPFQHVGFGGRVVGDPLVPFQGPPWIMFSTSNDGAQVYARVLEAGSTAFNTGNDKIPVGNYLGSPHTYRIEWQANSIAFYVDGDLKATVAVTIPDTLSLGVSDFNSAAPSLSVDWLRLSPYASPCTFDSRVFDAGEPVNWESMSWIASAPAGTALAFSYRTGDTATPDGSWTDFAPVANSGDSLAGTTRYIQYRVELSNTDQNLTPVIEDVTITYNTAPDEEPPLIVARQPLPDVIGVPLTAVVQVTFSEAMDPATFTADAFRLRVVGAVGDVPATTSVAGAIASLTPTAPLAPGRTYQVTVAGSVTDLAGNPLGDDDIWSFTAADQGALTDTSVADFNSGSPAACYVDESIGDGALRLPDALNEPFSGTGLPTGWSSHVWTDGSAIVEDGSLRVNGQVVRYETTVTGGVALEFAATFSAESFTHVGFGGAEPTYNDVPWIMFSTGSTGTELYTRVAAPGGPDNAFALGNQYLGAQHIYRIEWDASSIQFYIDGTLVDTRAVSINAPMRVAASDLNNNSTSLVVDWLRLGPPYLSPCVFESRVFDAQVVVDWLSAQWSGTTPTGTSVTVETRTGSSPVLESDWSDWQVVDVLGNMDNPDGRYAQYRLTLATTDSSVTPIVESVMLEYATSLGQFTGFVNLQGRPNDAGAVVELFNAANRDNAMLVARGTSAASGAFTSVYTSTQRLFVGEAYYFQINRPLFLPTTAVATLNPVINPLPDDWAHSATLFLRPLTQLNPVLLLGGDATNSNNISIGDAACIGGAFGSTTPGRCGLPGEPGYDPASTPDVNGDSAVNILDLTLMGGNYGKNSSPWTP